MKAKNVIIVAQAVALVALVVLIIYLAAGGRSGHPKSGIAETLMVPAKAEGQPVAPSATPGSDRTVVTEDIQEPLEGAVDIPQERQRLMGVKTAVAAVQPLQKTIRTIGRIEYDERKLATVNVKLESWVEKLYADYNGKPVKKGDLLADLYSPELVTYQDHYISIVKWNSQLLYRNFKERAIEFPFTDRYGTSARMTAWEVDIFLAKARERLKFWEMSEEQIKKIEETKEPIRTMSVRSPINGYVVQKQVVQGSRVMPGEKLFDIADLSTVWVIADVYEYELPLIKVGEKAKIRLSYITDKEFTAKVDYIYPVVSGQTRTARVRFTIPNPDGKIKPQMFTNTELTIDLGNRLAIPQDAIIDTGTRQVVYVDRGNGYFEPRAVALGVRAAGMAEVLRGLKAGDKVASAATFLIDSEAKLKNVVPLEQ